MKKSCNQISVLTEIDRFSVWCFKDLPQVSAYPAYFSGEFIGGNKVESYLHTTAWPDFSKDRQ